MQRTMSSCSMPSRAALVLPSFSVLSIMHKRRGTSQDKRMLMDGLPPCRRLTACHAHSSPIIRKVCDQLLLLSFRTSCISVVRRISFDRHSFGSPSIRRRLREGRFASSCCGFRVLNAKMNREYGLPPSWRCFEHFKPFLSEKTEGPNGRWWYTHRYLRKAVSLVRGCTDEAFTFLIAPSVPKTSNHV